MVVNGSTLQEARAPERLVPIRDVLFWNRDSKDGFYDVSAVAGPYFRKTYVGRGLAIADYDNDGDLDVFIVNNGGPGVLLRNDGGNQERWLEIRLEGRRSNRDAIGARVRIVAGGAIQLFEVGAQSSYLSQDSRIAHWGLGADTKVDTLDVRWPSGLQQRFHDVPVDRRLLLVEGMSPVADTAARPGRGMAAVAAAGTDGATAGGAVQRFWALFREATARRIAGRPEEAETLYEAALELNPAHESVLYYLGSVRLELGDFRGAGRAWERLIQVDPRSAKGFARLGDAPLLPDSRRAGGSASSRARVPPHPRHQRRADRPAPESGRGGVAARRAERGRKGPGPGARHGCEECNRALPEGLPRVAARRAEVRGSGVPRRREVSARRATAGRGHRRE